MKIEITKLHEDDWEKYKKIRLEALKNEPTAFGSSYEESKVIDEKEWRGRISNAIFALSDGIPVGMIVVMFNTRIKIKHVAYIFGFYVSQNVRRLGIGQKLMDAALKKIKSDKDIIKVNLTVNPQQESAITLYQKNGFNKVGLLSKELFFNNKFFDNLQMELFV